MTLTSLSFLCFFLVMCKSPHPTESNSTVNSSTQKTSVLEEDRTIRIEKYNASTDTLIKLVNGKKIKFKYDLNAKRDVDGNRLLWCKSFKDHEDILSVKLINDNTILYSEYFSDKRYDQFEDEYYDFDLVIPESIEFYNHKKELINTIKVRDSNPFLKSSKGDKRITEFFYDMGENYVYRISKNSIDDRDIKEKWIYSNVESIGSFTILNYSQESVNDDFEIVYVDHSISVFDSLGHIIYQHSTNHSAISNTISNDGRYFALIYDIERLTNDGSIGNNSGLEIWNTSSNKLVYTTTPSKKSAFVDGITSVLDENLIKFTIVNDSPTNKSNTWILLDCNDSTIYTREFPNKQLDQISLDWFYKYNSFKDLMKVFPFAAEKI